jgi:hypothetical protein
MALFPYQERVIAEKQDLDDKITRLDTFLSDLPEGVKLDPIDKGLLHQQLAAMKTYTNILRQRIGRFGG